MGNIIFGIVLPAITNGSEHQRAKRRIAPLYAGQLHNQSLVNLKFKPNTMQQNAVFDIRAISVG